MENHVRKLISAELLTLTTEKKEAVLKRLKELEVLDHHSYLQDVEEEDLTEVLSKPLARKLVKRFKKGWYE